MAECAHVGCGDSSPGTRATKQHQETGHAIMSSAMLGGGSQGRIACET